MVYNFNEDELDRVAALLHIGTNELASRLLVDDDINIISVSENAVKIKTRKGQFILELTQ
jgi:hypothetical protein